MKRSTGVCWGTGADARRETCGSVSADGAYHVL